MERVQQLPHPGGLTSLPEVSRYLQKLYEELQRDANLRPEDFSRYYSKTEAWVDVRRYSSFSAAIDAIGASKKTLLIPNEQTVAANKTVPSNVTLLFLQGGSLAISTGVTVTINGHVEAGLYRIFNCTGTGKVVFGSGAVHEIYPEWWGAIGDGNNWDVAIGSATDCLLAINSALASVTGVPVFFSDGIYMATECLYLKDDTHLKFSRGAWILGNHTGASVISLKGANECLLENPQVMGHVTTYPKTGIALGRTAAKPSSTRNAIYNPYVVGYFSEAGIYSIAAEEISFYTPRTDIRGGGAKYCFFTSDTDELAVDTFLTHSNTVVGVYGPNFVNEQTGLTGAAGIYIGTTEGSSFSHLYAGGWVGIKCGSYVQINSEYNGTLVGPIDFVNFHGEGFPVGAGTKGLYLSTSLTSDITFNGINMPRAFVSNPEYFLYADDHIIIQNSRIDPILPIGSSIYKATKSDFGMWDVLTMRDAYTPYIQVAASAYLNSAQTNLTDGTWTIVTLDAENFDTGEDFNPGTYTFTAPIAGYYLIHYQATFDNTIAETRYASAVYKDGVSILKGVAQTGTQAGVDRVSSGGSSLVYLPANAAIALYVMADCGASTVDLLSGADATYMSVVLVSK